MAKGFKHGSGGMPLNFNVVGNPQPTDPKENTIWLNTDVPIAGWYFQAEQPENLVYGEVWFLTDKYSTTEINALKKNGIQVYLISAKQYINGELANVPTMIYKNGEWVSLETKRYLYKRGDECTDITGGWSATTLVYGGDGSAYMMGTVRKNTDSILLDCSSSGQYQASVGTLKKIDVTNVSKLYLECTSVATVSNGYYDFGLITGAGNLKNVAVARAKIVYGEASLDVSNITGSYYVFVAINSAYGTGACATILDVWME